MNEVSNGEIIGCFDKGVHAARCDKAKSENPYRPLTDAEKYQAWDLGWHFENGAYVSMRVGDFG